MASDPIWVTAIVREVDRAAVSRWYEDLTAVRDLSPGTVVRHFNVMHHMMEKASTIWSKETGIDRNPADQVEVNRPDDATFDRLRLIVLIALTTGMRVSEIFGLRWLDVIYGEGLIAVRAKLKGGKMRYAPMPVELAAELRRFPIVIGRIGFFRRSQGQQADGSASRVASKTCSNGQESKISGFMICVTRLHPGT